MSIFCDAKYVDCDVEIVAGRYADNNHLALQLVRAEDGCPMARVTINANIDLADDEIIIKNYSENEGMLDFFLKNGLAERTGNVINFDFMDEEIVKVTEKLKSLIIH